MTPRAEASQLPWIVAGAAILVAIVAVMLPTIRGTTGAATNGAAQMADAPFAGGATSGSDGTGQPPPLDGTPRELADRLFNRIMQERSQGNEERAKFFVPMATQAYQNAMPLDADGLYHLSLIQAVGGDFASARKTAQQILDASPTHLLALGALAEASLSAGDSAAARAAWRKFLDNLSSEKAKQLPEYNDHAPILTEYEQTARKLLGK